MSRFIENSDTQRTVSAIWTPESEISEPEPLILDVKSIVNSYLLDPVTLQEIPADRYQDVVDTLRNWSEDHTISPQRFEEITRIVGFKRQLPTKTLPLPFPFVPKADGMTEGSKANVIKYATTIRSRFLKDVTLDELRSNHERTREIRAVLERRYGTDHVYRILGENPIRLNDIGGFALGPLQMLAREYGRYEQYQDISQFLGDKGRLIIQISNFCSGAHARPKGYQSYHEMNFDQKLTILRSINNFLYDSYCLIAQDTPTREYIPVI
jgi:hypothetical protein